MRANATSEGMTEDIDVVTKYEEVLIGNIMHMDNLSFLPHEMEHEQPIQFRNQSVKGS